MLDSPTLLRWTRFWICAAVLVAARAAGASEIDPSTGLLMPGDPDAILIGFEDAAQLATYGVALTKYQQGNTGYGSTLVFVDSNGTPMTGDELVAHEAADPAVEGSHALLLGKGPSDGAAGVLVPFANLAPLIKKAQIQVTVWVRTNGATPSLIATYGNDVLPSTGTFTSVTAIRTGRETSDGWAEL